jgi:hypothetical protein
MIRKFLIALAGLGLAASALAADKPLVIESGKVKQLPASTTLQVNASGTGAASLNIPHGTAPTSPNNGDCWTTTTGLFCRVNGATVGPYGTGTGSGTVTTSGSPASGNLSKFSGATAVTNGDLSGDVTTSGTLATTIANNAVTTAKINDTAVTLAKIANAAANSKLVGSGAAGSGAAYSEITLGSGLTMTGTTLSASGGSGTVTTTGSPASGNLTKFSGASSVTNSDLTGDITTSGTLATTIANNAVTTAKINDTAVTLAKIANAAANSKLVGSGAAGSGAAYSEITLGSGLTMTGTTLSASASGGYEAGPAGTLPTIASMTSWNIGTSSISGGTHAHVFVPQNGGVYRGYYLAVPTAPFDIYMRIRQFNYAAGGSPQNWGGILLRDNATGKSLIVGYDFGSRIEIARATSAGGYSASGTTLFFGAAPAPRWIRANVTSTTITMYISNNGWDWVQVGTETISTYISAVTHYGFADYVAGTDVGGVYIDYLSTTAPS